jgi:hypothetical protein
MWCLLIKTNSSSRQREDSISKHTNGIGTNKNLIMGPETKNDCAGETSSNLLDLMSTEAEESPFLEAPVMQ